jgi:hypothetical protein
MQYLIASASLHDQLLLLKSHPSVLVFMLSSDELPPPDVEEMYRIPTASPPLQLLLPPSSCFSPPPTPQRLTAALKVHQRDAQPALARPRADRLRRRRRQLLYIRTQRRQDVWSLQLGDTITITRLAHAMRELCGRFPRRTSTWMTDVTGWEGGGGF